jgi:hypothetical protein
VGTDNLSAAGRTALDAARRLPAAERQAVALALAAELLVNDPARPAVWSRPATLTVLAARFDISRATLAKRIKDGTVRAKPFGKLWQVAVECLPPPRGHC